ncbi:hypothetical protein I553_3022 [Mycobacterium xenopi 4042]|uniref:Uncharacterized protein n=1 Tax=Mycobacterium xenopi 4042 TaxID=1299334 RepID=X7ZPS7_MYCXE|nr:hypothetical protein I553_3022 [Mycobacterium xenopi 4042]
MPGNCGRFGRLPLAIDAIIDGQYIDIAMLVNICAIAGDMPFWPVMPDAAEANVPPGWAAWDRRTGQCDGGSGIAVVDTRIVQRRQNCSSTEFAWTGAAPHRPPRPGLPTSALSAPPHPLLLTCSTLH